MGHLVEYLQTDIWVRFQKLRGHHCIYVCASDAHGTPVMLKARELGVTAESLTQTVSAEFVKDFADFGIEFDNYYTTHSIENEEIVGKIFATLRERGDIYTRTIEQSYDEQEGMFLPDRFVRGTCPRCNSEDQYGDACEVCGSTYAPEDLLDPKSVLSGTTPVTRRSEHYFFRLSDYEIRLRDWMSDAGLDKQLVAKLDEWFSVGLQDWDISRDAPYFGFKIPGTDDKYFYVWLDAPVGYMASFKNLCDRSDDLDFDGGTGNIQTGGTTAITAEADQDVLFAQEITVDGEGIHIKEGASATPVTGYGLLETTSANELMFTDGDGNLHIAVGPAFASMSYHNIAQATTTITTDNEFVPITAFDVIDAFDSLSNIVADPITDDDFTAGANAAGQYQCNYHASINVAGGAARDLLIAVGCNLATPLDITNVTDNTITPIVVTSTAHERVRHQGVTNKPRYVLW